MLINNINFKYGSNEIYNNFNIEFQQGKVNCIIGESGCGKTTLLNYISEKLYYENKRIAYVFQEDNLIPWKNIYVNLKIVAKKYFEKSILEKEINKQFKNSLDSLLPKKLIDAIINLSKINPNKKVNEITKQERSILVKLLKEFSITLQGFRPIDEAIVTAGGINIKEINPKTMESKIIKGLFFAGEIIDVDAYTGGFNLQIAYSTGYTAGISESEQ